MSKYDCPVGFTCLGIDDAISDANKASEYLENALVHVNELIGKYGSLEALRSQNAQLRQWGEELLDRVRELEEEKEILERQLEERGD